MPQVVRPAAQYLRMSTEHQNYSLDYQAAHNAEYALQQGYEVVRSYVDAGISGLRLKRRDGLKQLLADVVAGGADYRTVLVYDVSRWGRFQDVDQGAHYEFVCRQAGVEVVYTAEPFDNDGSLPSTIVKQVKRAMAAEFSRELSAKTSRAMRGLALEGFWTNGPPGYALRRLAVTRDKQPRFLMETGQQKAIRGHRTVLVHGPADEVATVRRIFSLFLVAGMKPASIAALLNQESPAPPSFGRWSASRVRAILRNEKYCGAFHRNKTTGSLGSRRSRPRGEWLQVPGSIPPIIDRSTFDAVQTQFRSTRSRNASDAELLDELRLVLRDHGRISRALIDKHRATHCADVIGRRFGGLVNAMRLAGAEPTPRQVFASDQARRVRPGAFRTRTGAPDKAATMAALRAHFAARGFISWSTIDEDPALPSAEGCRRLFGGMGTIYALVGHEPTDAQRRALKRAPSTRLA